MTKRILVIGAGFAGMWSALASARLVDQVGRKDVEIVVVAPEPQLHLRPRLYEKNPGGMKAPLLDVFKTVGVRFIYGRVRQIDVVKKEVAVVAGEGPSGRLIAYDRLVLAAGSRLTQPNIPGLNEHSFNVDQVEAAAKLEAHINDLSKRPASTARNTVVIVGAGFTGIETAAEIPHRLKGVLGQGQAVRVILVDRAPDIGSDLGPGPRPVITQALTELGVTWKLGSGVAAVSDRGVTLESGELIEAETIVWTGGIRASALTEQIPASRDAYGRLYVDKHLKVKGADGVFVTGDCAYAETDSEGNHTMMSCQHALRLGRSAGHNVAADLMRKQMIPYSQASYVTCLDLGPWGAIYTEGWDRQVKMSGAEAKKLKTKINTQWIYPPTGDRAAIFALADPQLMAVVK